MNLISIIYSQLAVMEKNKLHILEEGVDGIAEPNVGNLCHMENLEVRIGENFVHIKYIYMCLGFGWLLLT